MPTVALDQATALALDRTRAAFERTMMAWIRTGTSLITFGFTIYKFFQLETPERLRDRYAIGPRQFAVALVSIGLIAIVLATIEYRTNIREIRRQGGPARLSLAVFVGMLTSLLGILAIILIIFRE
ncbi:MAG TPA: DUF202 domain-containing protein [Candidatus Binataceae bacterium]|nr:DUF202 domain-containing protein [Candidatus Binataceae bacterium]